MDQKYFRVPFATSGDVTVVPDDTQPDGSVSYEQGFPFDYQRELGVDPDAKAIGRGTFNDLMLAITENIQQYQQFSAPEFITTSDNDGSPYSYSSGARVRYDDGGGFQVYVSLVDSNTALPTDTTKWAPVVDAPATTAQAIAAALNSVAMTPLNLIMHPNVASMVANITGQSSNGVCTINRNIGPVTSVTRTSVGVYDVVIPQMADIYYNICVSFTNATTNATANGFVIVDQTTTGFTINIENVNSSRIDPQRMMIQIFGERA